ncbi:class IIb bacteriocin, lactobin A/cerein 7B family [Shewanella insulae]|uniref:Class IIb bacteriocin, lactobin A/cerein 7B family n=1 Tax=Shewanella insulae TaxID=2681496 RepID=A0A6L7HX19_9GAMM|nr:class IIb bacteriocin, lactobin A/cerein 7B family [Shewanella insulae]MCG9740281.1 class IIb bacteriocin, lactobin A/cerein 7B family [Shewanella insulae]MXR67688.1 class IIb bacteriocin, lactobin A/cerein 7B family [Shewanella insulae]
MQDSKIEELTLNEIEQVHGGWVPVVMFVGRVALGWASAALYNKAQ